jgi:4-hydroxybenzoate polyprenyltransferase
MNQIKAYAQLLRIPNVFTAWADVMLGVLAACLGPGPRWATTDDIIKLVFGLGAISTCMYVAGMILNDCFDVAEDRRDRPHRPIPSGQIRWEDAVGLGLALIGVGLLLAAFPIFAHEVDAAISGKLLEMIGTLRVWHTLPIAAALALCILLYDVGFKRLWIGPVLMGTCRFLNVFLAIAFLATPPELWKIHIALTVGLYITGVTWFARKEAAMSGRWSLVGATCVMGMSILVALSWPMLWESYAGWELGLFPVFLGMWAIVIAVPVARAIYEPTPQRVQLAVKTCILGLIGLDAILAFGVVGWPGLLILLLLIPAVVLGRWVYST